MLQIWTRDHYKLENETALSKYKRTRYDYLLCQWVHVDGTTKQINETKVHFFDIVMHYRHIQWGVWDPVYKEERIIVRSYKRNPKAITKTRQIGRGLERKRRIPYNLLYHSRSYDMRTRCFQQNSYLRPQYTPLPPECDFLISILGGKKIQHPHLGHLW